MTMHKISNPVSFTILRGRTSLTHISTSNCVGVKQLSHDFVFFLGNSKVDCTGLFLPRSVLVSLKVKDNVINF